MIKNLLASPAGFVVAVVLALTLAVVLTSIPSSSELFRGDRTTTSSATQPAYVELPASVSPAEGTTETVDQSTNPVDIPTTPVTSPEPTGKLMPTLNPPQVNPPGASVNFEAFARNCRPAPPDGPGKANVTFTVFVNPTGGNGQYTITRDRSIVVGAAFDVTWERGTAWTGSIQVLSDGQSISKDYFYSLADPELGCP